MNKRFYKNILNLIRILVLGATLLSIFFSIVGLIWTKATNGSKYMSGFLFNSMTFLGILIPVILFYFLVRRFTDKLKNRKSPKSLIIIELTFTILVFITLFLVQIEMIIYLFDIVIFAGLLIAKTLLIILAYDSVSDYKTTKTTANNT
ncbi:MAG: hypothetical protein HRT68_01885 [Flavobacteriaceae bacterium]|nr:hypothetical protein [Flavobacteriaceae bacterium]